MNWNNVDWVFVIATSRISNIILSTCNLSVVEVEQLSEFTHFIRFNWVFCWCDCRRWIYHSFVVDFWQRIATIWVYAENERTIVAVKLINSRCRCNRCQFFWRFCYFCCCVIITTPPHIPQSFFTVIFLHFIFIFLHDIIKIIRCGQRWRDIWWRWLITECTTVVYVNAWVIGKDEITWMFAQTINKTVILIAKHTICYRFWWRRWTAVRITAVRMWQIFVLIRNKIEIVKTVQFVVDNWWFLGLHLNRMVILISRTRLEQWTRRSIE